MSARIIVSTVACCAVLAGCGQRGALYLPEAGRNVVVTPAQPAASPEPAASPATNAAPAPAASPATTAPVPTDTTEEQRRRNAAAPATR
jgi:predicted small lipoprotein YifL